MSFTIVDARNPKWAHPDHNKIDLEVNFEELPEEYIPFTADPTDEVAHGRELYTRAAAGEFGEIAEYVHKNLWYPVDRTFIEVSTESLVQILLEKGVLTDEEVDMILVEDTRTVGFAVTTNEPGEKIFNGS